MKDGITIKEMIEIHIKNGLNESNFNLKIENFQNQQGPNNNLNEQIQKIEQ